jgi:DNA polymerase-3 subunit alpha
VAPTKWAGLDEDGRARIVSDKWTGKPEDYPWFDFDDERLLIEMETDLLGTHVSVDPMGRYSAMIEGECIRHPSDVEDHPAGARFTVGGELVKVKRHRQRDGRDMAFLVVRWNEEDFDVVVFADGWEANQRMLQETGVPVACEVVKLKGKGCQLSVVERLDWL